MMLLTRMKSNHQLVVLTDSTSFKIHDPLQIKAWQVIFDCEDAYIEELVADAQKLKCQTRRLQSCTDCAKEYLERFKQCPEQRPEIRETLVEFVGNLPSSFGGTLPGGSSGVVVATTSIQQEIDSYQYSLDMANQQVRNELLEVQHMHHQAEQRRLSCGYAKKHFDIMKRHGTASEQELQIAEYNIQKWSNNLPWRNANEEEKRSWWGGWEMIIII